MIEAIGYYDKALSLETDDDVKNELVRLKGIKFVGPIIISGILLQAIRFSITFYLCFLFRKFLDTKIYLYYIKLTSVAQVFKFGDASDANNYKSISIISHIGKLLLVLRYIWPAVNQVLADKQHEFRLRHSVTTCKNMITNYLIDVFASKN